MNTWITSAGRRWRSRKPLSSDSTSALVTFMLENLLSSPNLSVCISVWIRTCPVTHVHACQFCVNYVTCARLWVCLRFHLRVCVRARDNAYLSVNCTHASMFRVYVYLGTHGYLCINIFVSDCMPADHDMSLREWSLHVVCPCLHAWGSAWVCLLPANSLLPIP